MNFPGDRSEDRRFETLMRNLEHDGSFSSTSPLVPDGETYARTKATLLSAGTKLVDSRPEHGFLETDSAVFRIVERECTDESIVGDVAIAASYAFKNRKHFFVLAPELSELLEYRILALGHADYFSFRNLGAALCTSEMQISRALTASVRASMQRSEAPVADSAYWKATAKAVGWLVVSVAFYVTLRHRFPAAYLDLVAVLPFWIRAFYGTRFSAITQRDLTNAKWRVVQTNIVVAPLLALSLIASIVFLPALIAPLGVAALAVDCAGFFSATFAKAVAIQSDRFPTFLR